MMSSHSSSADTQVFKDSIRLKDIKSEYLGCRKKHIWPWSSALEYCQAWVSLTVLKQQPTNYSVGIDVECTGIVEISGVNDRKINFTKIISETTSAYIFVLAEELTPYRVGSIIIEYHVDPALRVHDAKIIDVQCKITNLEVIE